MNILLETQLTQDIKARHLLLELDSFRTSPDSTPVSAFCLIEKMPLVEMMNIAQYHDLHHNLMPNYRQRNWPYVEQAIEHLMGRWDHQLDSFYQDLLDRVQDFKQHTLGPDWDGVINRF